MDKKNAIRTETKIFYAVYPNNSPIQAFFHLGKHGTVLQTELLTILEVTKDLH